MYLPVPRPSTPQGGLVLVVLVIPTPLYIGAKLRDGLPLEDDGESALPLIFVWYDGLHQVGFALVAEAQIPIVEVVDRVYLDAAQIEG